MRPKLIVPSGLSVTGTRGRPTRWQLRTRTPPHPTRLSKAFAEGMRRRPPRRCLGRFSEGLARRFSRLRRPRFSRGMERRPARKPVAASARAWRKLPQRVRKGPPPRPWRASAAYPWRSCWTCAKRPERLQTKRPRPGTRARRPGARLKPPRWRLAGGYCAVSTAKGSLSSQVFPGESGKLHKKCD
jgi:hypothetical protein